MPAIPVDIRQKFFEYLFGTERGYVCIATAPKENPRSKFQEKFFAWPEQSDEVADYCEKMAHKRNVWFGINLLSATRRLKKNCVTHNVVWSDLDTANPAKIVPAPSVLIQSSPFRYQAIWRLDQEVSPEIAEDYSKRLAYKYREDGVDPTGWDLTQLLRVPFTFNHKYGNPAPQVKLLHAHDTLVPVELMEAIEPAPLAVEEVDLADVPAAESLPRADQIVYKYWPSLRDTVFTTLHANVPEVGADWSRLLWRLINICLEAGMSPQETFAVAFEAKCNKYVRDKRPPRYLWREVKKAAEGQKQLTVITSNFVPIAMPSLVPLDTELPRYFTDDYKDWAVEATDAVPQFHELTSFILLSTLLASTVTLEAQYGTVYPNLWGLILGDSTLTRKTTAMRLVMEIIQEIDDELLLATDGSAEGLVQGLSTRPNRVSLYYRDEVSGFFDSINRKDYLAGMPELLTQLYDVPGKYARRLRKDTIIVTKPFFIFFGGGIKDKVYSLISDEYVLSGFLPRFLVVSGNADMERIRRTGPPSHDVDVRKADIKHTVGDIYEAYNRTAIMKLAGQETQISVKYKAELTPKAWERYGQFEMTMVEAASASSAPMLAMPTFERLSRSMLKMSILLACSRGEPQEQTVEVTETDVLKAAMYVQDWGRYSVDLIVNAGRSGVQRLLERVRDLVARKPGILRSDVMRHFSFTKREADEVFNTLADRGEVHLDKQGKGTKLWPI